MVTNVEIEKTGNENNVVLIKKFNKKVQGSGILAKARSKRYSKRVKSDYAKKTQALKSIKKRKEIDRMIKLGKLPDRRSK